MLYSFFQLESCLPRPELFAGYSSLLDGQLLHAVWLQIDPEPSYHLSKILDTDGHNSAYARSKNLDSIVKNIKNLYEEEFGQTVLAVPDCFILGKNPGKWHFAFVSHSLFFFAFSVLVFIHFFKIAIDAWQISIF